MIVFCCTEVLFKVPLTFRKDEAGPVQQNTSYIQVANFHRKYILKGTQNLG